jgi:hypothetical protein
MVTGHEGFGPGGDWGHSSGHDGDVLWIISGVLQGASRPKRELGWVASRTISGSTAENPKFYDNSD